MSLRACAAVLMAVAGLWLASGTQRERPLVAQAKTDAVRVLETEVAAHPSDVVGLQKLAQAYLDAHSPGLAVSMLESAPTDVRDNTKVEHLYARALVAQGRNQDALVAERRVLAKCSLETAHCDSYLVASAQHRADILQELVNMGVDDAQANPEASRVAYQNATREARVAILQ